jgi:predicted kinase
MKAIIIDIDGTLSNPEHRLHHLSGEKDWKAFHGAMGEDPPVEAIAQLARIMYRASEAGLGIDAVLIVTARHDDPLYERLTREWLELHDIPYHRLYMRRDSDTRRDHLVKRDILQQILDDGYEPILAVDDRPEVVRMWRDHGITTLQCAPDDPGASPYAGKTLLHMMVGPAGAGKSTYVEREYRPEDVISTDALRMQLYGNLGQSPEALARVWKYAHGLITARLASGVFTVLDATNLEAEDRARVLALLPRGVFARYIVIDREIDTKIAHRGWRSEDLVIKHHRLFRREEKAILSGDEHPWVTVQDRRHK